MKSYYGRPIGTHQRSFERYHPRPHTARLGVRNTNPKLQSLLSQERVKIRNTNCKFSRVHPNKSPLQIWEKMVSDLTAPGVGRLYTGRLPQRETDQRGRIKGLPKFLEYTPLSQEQIIRNSNLAGTFTGSVRAKVHYKFGRKWTVGVSRDCRNFLSTPYDLIGMGTLNFVRTFIGYRSEQKPIKNFGKSSRGRTQGLSKIFRAPIYGASRGHLCGSSAFLLSVTLNNASDYGTNGLS